MTRIEYKTNTNTESKGKTGIKEVGGVHKD